MLGLKGKGEVGGGTQGPKSSLLDEAMIFVGGNQMSTRGFGGIGEHLGFEHLPLGVEVNTGLVKPAESEEQ